MLNAQSLKTVIAVNIALLLLTAVILIDFVFVSTSQKNHIKKKTEEARVMAMSVQNALFTGEDHGLKLSLETKRYLTDIAEINDITSIVIAGQDVSPLFVKTGDDGKLRQILINGATQTLLSGESSSYLYGKVWGVFFIRNHYLIVSSPLRIGDGAIPAAVSSAVDLASFYALQRENQMLVAFYTIINVLVLTMLGTYAISRAAIRPINSLVKRAEEHQEHNQLDFFYPRGKNEFRRLSTSLNRMLDRITEDKSRLKGSLVRLEEANREIKDRQNELIRAEKLASVGRLSAGIAHEIGNPVGIVLGYLDMLNSQDLTANEKQDYVSRCQKEINKINTIIRELLDFSRPSGQETRETVSVHALIKETMDLLAVQPVMRNINKKYEFRAPCDTVDAVPDKLRQVFVNLILNAADAISAGCSGNGEIVINSLAATGKSGETDTLHIEISDNGAGINEADLGAIFDPFYTTKDPGQGTGLGLYVCYMIIDSLGGSISVVSRQGEGTTFTIRLPLSGSGPDRI